MKSKRQDGRGHWPRHKPRSTCTPAQVAQVLRRLNRALAEQSQRQVGRTLGIHGTQVGRIFRGEDLPSAATAALVMERL